MPAQLRSLLCRARTAALLAVAICALLAPAAPATPVFQVYNAVGVAELGDGTIFVHNVPLFTGTIGKYSATGTLLDHIDDASSFPGRLAVEPGDAHVWDVRKDGLLRRIATATLAVPEQKSLRTVVADAAHVYDVSTGGYRDMAAEVLGGPGTPGDTAYFGDVAVRAGGGRVDVYVTGRSTTNHPFVERVSWLNGTFEGARVLASSTAASSQAAPPGVAVLPDGSLAATLLTCLPLPSNPCAAGASKLYVFPPDLADHTSGSLAGVHAHTGVPSEGLDADSSGRIYANGGVGLNACWMKAYAVFDTAARPITCWAPFGSSTGDLDVRPDGSTVLATGLGALELTRETVPTTAVPRRILVSRSGDGSGRVTGDAYGIDCGSTCEGSAPLGGQITLSAIADADTDFKGWNVPECPGLDPHCTLTTDDDLDVRARFDYQRVHLHLEVTPTGTGSINGHVSGSQYDSIYCSSVCDEEFRVGTKVNLYFSPELFHDLESFDGPCESEPYVDCAVTLDEDATVTATFCVAFVGGCGDLPDPGPGGGGGGGAGTTTTPTPTATTPATPVQPAPPQPGPGQVTATSTAPPSCHVTLRAVRLAKALRSGLPGSVRCDGRATIELTVSVPAAVARRVGLASAVVASARGVVRRAGASPVRVTFDGRARRKLRGLRRLVLTAALSARASPGATPAQTAATVTLRR